MKTALHKHLLLLIGCVFLMILLLPILDIFTHPFSVLGIPGYDPLINRLPDFPYSFFSLAFFAVPALVVLLIVLMQSYGLHFTRVLVVLLIPFVSALTIQYFIAVQLDKYLRFPSLGHPIPWQHVFQFPFMRHCFWLAVIYAATCAATYGIAAVARKQLSIRWSERAQARVAQL